MAQKCMLDDWASILYMVFFGKSAMGAREDSNLISISAYVAIIACLDQKKPHKWQSFTVMVAADMLEKLHALPLLLYHQPLTSRAHVVPHQYCALSTFHAGEYVAVEKLELAYKKCPLVDQVCNFGLHFVEGPCSTSQGTNKSIRHSQESVQHITAVVQGWCRVGAACVGVRQQLQEHAGGGGGAQHACPEGAAAVQTSSCGRMKAPLVCSCFLWLGPRLPHEAADASIVPVFVHRPLF
eukprot:scaffold40888_cov20-Tisochrysis_lutea.AAC.2